MANIMQKLLSEMQIQGQTHQAAASLESAQSAQISPNHSSAQIFVKN